MTKSNASTTIVKFHIGRGGRFNNPGHKTFQGISRIDEGTDFESLFLNEETNEYHDESGNNVDLTLEEAQTGVGTIDLDGSYDTTYTKYLTDINIKELEIIGYSNHYENQQVLDELSEIHNCEKSELFLYIN